MTAPHDVRRVLLGEAGAFDVLSAYASQAGSSETNNPLFSPFLRAVRESKVFFDVGAHAGLYTLPACRLIPEGGAVHAFEANSATHESLVTHLALNGIRSCSHRRVFVGESSGERIFFENLDSPDRSSFVRPSDDRERSVAVTVPEITLDEYCIEHRTYPDLVKIDVEGAELAVLRGAERLLRERRPMLILSVHPGLIERSGDTVRDLEDICSRHSYSFRDFRGQRGRGIGFGDYMMTPSRSS